MDKRILAILHGQSVEEEMSEYEKHIEEQVQADREGEAALAYYYEHPEEWPTCSSCGRRKSPTGFGDNARVEFHCGTGGHAVTLIGRP